MATRPARAPFKVMDASGFLYLIQTNIIAESEPAAAAMAVFTAMVDMAGLEADSVLPGLKPNHPNHSIKTPSAAMAILCPGMALDDFRQYYIYPAWDQEVPHLPGQKGLRPSAPL